MVLETWLQVLTWLSTLTSRNGFALLDRAWKRNMTTILSRTKMVVQKQPELHAIVAGRSGQSDCPRKADHLGSRKTNIDKKIHGYSNCLDFPYLGQLSGPSLANPRGWIEVTHGSTSATENLSHLSSLSFFKKSLITKDSVMYWAFYIGGCFSD